MTPQVDVSDAATPKGAPPWPELTQRQSEVFAFVRRFRQETGRSPTVGLMALRFGVCPRGILSRMRSLETKGYIRRDDVDRSSRWWSPPLERTAYPAGAFIPAGMSNLYECADCGALIEMKWRLHKHCSRCTKAGTSFHATVETEFAQKVLRLGRLWIDPGLYAEKPLADQVGDYLIEAEAARETREAERRKAAAEAARETREAERRKRQIINKHYTIMHLPARCKWLGIAGHEAMKFDTAGEAAAWVEEKKRERRRHQSLLTKGYQ